MGYKQAEFIGVSTHSRLKAAGWHGWARKSANGLFQHTAA